MNMNPREIVQALVDSVQRGDFEKAQSFLSTNYQFSGPIPTPMDGETWMAINPNLDYHFHLDGVDGLDGSVIRMSSELKGTHRGTLDLSPLGMGTTPATDKSIATPREHGRVTIKGDKVVSWVVDRIEGGGFMGILGQLGLTVPGM
jgi:hypothetical protein